MSTTDTNVPQVIVNKLTQAQYNTATKSPTEFYAVTDGQIETADIADGAITPAKASFTTYSTTEQTVGTWIDGNTIYRRVYEIPTTSINSTATTVVQFAYPTGLSQFIKVGGVITTQTSGYVIDFNGASGANSSVGVCSRCDGGISQMRVLVDKSMYAETSFSGFLVVEYTKSS